MATTKYGLDALCICHNEKSKEIVSLLNSNDNTQVQEYVGDTDNKTRKRSRPEKDDGDSGNKRKK